MNPKFFLCLAIYLMSVFVVAAEDEKKHDFELGASLMEIGGSARIPMSVNRHDEFHLGVEVAPAFGVFLTQQLELRSSLLAKTSFVFTEQQRKATPPFFWGGAVAAVYYFKTQSVIWPYLGGGLGFELMNWNIFSLGLLVELPVGMLIALSKNIALDIGMPISIRISVRSLTDMVSFPIGVLGLRYYF